jgi:hypothetical protein
VPETFSVPGFRQTFDFSITCGLSGSQQEFSRMNVFATLL